MMAHKKYLIVCPTALEATFLLGSATRMVPGIECFSLEGFKAKVDILISGIGIHKTTYSLTKILSKNTYDFVIHIGIAGSYDENLPLASLVAVQSEVFGDLGMASKKGFSTLFDLELAQKEAFPFTGGRMMNRSPQPEYFNQYAKTQGVTVNSLLTDKDKNNIRANKFQAQIESMEGAAVFFVCLNERIEFIEIRGISNYVGERDKSKWKIDKAVENLNNAILDFLNN